VREPEDQDDGSIERVRHLLRRLAYSAREGYQDFNSARLSLADSRPKRMSQLTRRLLHTIDWAQTARVRKANYDHLSVRLDATNARPWLRDLQATPMCYPYTREDIDMATVRRELADRHGIFCATYWPDVTVRAKVGSIEEMMTKQTLFLPMDQRLNMQQLDRICDIIGAIVNGN
jgi:hypothetical protein